VKSASPCILTLNGGSSSIRFSVYESGEMLRLRLAGKIDRIGLRGTCLTATEPAGRPRAPQPLAAGDHVAATGFLLDWLEAQPLFASVKAVGHRLVHGMRHSEPERVTPKLLAELHRITPYDPDHLPHEIGLIEAFRLRHPKVPQVACFDTAFHRTMPPIARLLPIPRRYTAKGVQRYGFHGLSYA
jgi:acetate kinase